MGIAKCRLDIWSPVIGGSVTNKWVTAETVNNHNAVVSVFISDKMANARSAEVTVANKGKNYSGSGTFTYTYRDSDGVSLGNSTVDVRVGVLTDIFHDFQQVRIVELATNQVLFAGRITDVDNVSDQYRGQVIKLTLKDALEDLRKTNPREYVNNVKFYQAGDSDGPSGGHSRTDMVKALISIAYKMDYLRDEYNLKRIPKSIKGKWYGSLTPNDGIVTDYLVADTTYQQYSYRANVVTDDTGAPTAGGGGQYRFTIDANKIGKTEELKLDNAPVNKGLLGEINRILSHVPKSSSVNNKEFGWDYFVDPNIGYKEDVAFKGKNLDVQTAPPPQMLNVFERGTRIYNMEPANYGLTIKLPNSGVAVTRGHKTVTSGGSTTTSTAIRVMNTQADFDYPKDGLYTGVYLQYDDEEEKNSVSGVPETSSGKTSEILMEIMYVTEISGQFKWTSVTGSGATAVVEDLNLNPKIASGIHLYGGHGSQVSELLDLYNEAGNSKLVDNVAQIQYQSDTTLSGSTLGYILVSPAENYDVLLQNQTITPGTYTLKGAGDGEGNNASNATCKINLAATVGSAGYPRRVWGVTKNRNMVRASSTSLHTLRQEVASILSRSSTQIVKSKFDFSGLPLYYWDGEIRTITNTSPGQIISVRNVGQTDAVDVTRFGFREGMLIAKMDASYSSQAQANNKDVYGYCWNVPSATTYNVDLTESQTFSVGDPVRFYVPIRAGDMVRVENIPANVAGNHLVTEVTFTEEPNQVTKLSTVGVNEGIGITPTIFQAIVDGSRDESITRLNLPKGHQVAVWTGLFSAVDFNTVQWQTVGGRADVLLQDGSTYAIDTDTGSGGNTTHSTETDGSDANITFGIANAAHPAAGDATLYYIYLDPNKEQVETGAKYHFYTRPSTSPVSGSDTVYEQDGDNIIVGWMKAGATADDYAEFGVYRDSKPDNTMRSAPAILHAGSTTSALLKKGAQTFTTDLQIVPTEWANDDAIQEVKWHGDDSNGAPSDTENATIKLADGTERTIAYGGDTSDNGGGVYSATSNGTSYSNIDEFAVNKTYYAFIDFTADASGNMTLRWTVDPAVPYGDNKILLAMITIPPNANSGRSPRIFPLTTKSLTVNAVAIAANAITADHVQANSISAGHINGVLPGNKITVNADTTFASGYDPTTAGGATTTYAATAPGSPTTGDIWIDSDDNKFYRYSGSAWVEIDVGYAASKANRKRVFIVRNSDTEGTPTPANSNSGVAFDKGDTWLDTYTGKLYSNDGTGYSFPSDWTLKDDVGAINNATTNINGGRILTQTIILKAGGAGLPNNTTSILSQHAFDASATNSSRLVLSETGIFGYDSNEDVQFKIQATDGKGVFNAGKIILDDAGVNVYASVGGTLNTQLASDGLKMKAGLSSGVDFRTNTTGTIVAMMNTTGTGSGTYGNTASKFALTSSFLNISIESLEQDIGLFPDPTEGYVKINDRPLVWMDTTSTIFQDAGMEFVGLWKRTGDITNSIVYRLPILNTALVNGGVNVGDNRHLKIESISGDGDKDSPYLVDLEWASQVEGGAFIFDSGGDSNGYYKLRGVLVGVTNAVSLGVETVNWFLRRNSSSIRFKENIANISLDTSKILDLVPRSFTWKEQEDIGEEIWGKPDFGLIAEEVHEIFPELVTYEQNNTPATVRYDMIGVLLLEEVKKLKARIEVLEGS